MYLHSHSYIPFAPQAKEHFFTLPPRASRSQTSHFISYYLRGPPGAKLRVFISYYLREPPGEHDCFAITSCRGRSVFFCKPRLFRTSLNIEHVMIYVFFYRGGPGRLRANFCSKTLHKQVRTFKAKPHWEKVRFAFGGSKRGPCWVKLASEGHLKT